MRPQEVERCQKESEKAERGENQREQAAGAAHAPISSQRQQASHGVLPLEVPTDLPLGPPRPNRAGSNHLKNGVFCGTLEEKCRLKYKRFIPRGPDPARNAIMNPLLYFLLPTLSACALAAGMGCAFRRQRRTWEREAARQEAAWRQERERHRQTVQAVTGGRLRLCEPEEVAALLTGERVWTLPLLEAGDVFQFRRNLRQIAGQRGLSPARLDDLCSCVSEAAGSALERGQGGVAQVWAEDGGFAVLVTDCGGGLPPEALFESLSFQLMLALCDTLALSTSAEGTQLLLKIRHQPAPPSIQDEAIQDEAGLRWAQAV